jgi:hypothetical protein
MDKQQLSSETESLAAAIVELGGVMEQIIRHMALQPGATNKSIDQVLKSLIGGVLDPLVEADPSRFAVCSAAMSAATERIAEEIYLVPPTES